MSSNYFRLKLVSPKKVLTWCERKLPSGGFVGKIENSFCFSNI
jgi:hypothetical protein